jgi:hypothetical protein
MKPRKGFTQGVDEEKEKTGVGKFCKIIDNLSKKE